MQKGKTVYQESQTFDRKTTAQAWLKKRETELAEPGAIAKANREGVRIKEMIDRYPMSTTKTRRWARRCVPPCWPLARRGWARSKTRTSIASCSSSTGCTVWKRTAFRLRRQEEITRLRWDAMNEKQQTVLITDMKNPGKRYGNDVWCHVPDEAWRIPS
jgi:hypothetical protein